MNGMQIPNEYEIWKLSSSFYNDYPESQYPEILRKSGRPYNVIVFETKEDYYVCVPFRTYLNHQQGFHFPQHNHLNGGNPGIDYSKMLIVKNDNYIGQATLIEPSQMAFFNANIATIQQEIFGYLEGYINHINGTTILHPRQFIRKYQYTTLKYFHSELGISN